MFEILVTFVININAKSLLTYPYLNFINTSKKWFSWMIDLAVGSTLGLTRDNNHLNRCTFKMPFKKFNVLSLFLILSTSMTFLFVYFNLSNRFAFFFLCIFSFCWTISVLCFCFIKAASTNFFFGDIMKSVCVPERNCKNAATISFFAIKSLVIPGHLKAWRSPA